jgi:hypothetical protein
MMGEPIEQSAGQPLRAPSRGPRSTLGTAGWCQGRLGLQSAAAMSIEATKIRKSAIVHQTTCCDLACPMLCTSEIVSVAQRLS